MSPDAPEKNPFLGMIGMTKKPEKPAEVVPTKEVPPSPRDAYDASISFRTHHDVRQKLRRDALAAGELIEDYMCSLCLDGLPKSAPRRPLPNKAESAVRVTFRASIGLRRKVRQDALDHDMKLEEYLTSLVLYGRRS